MKIRFNVEQQQLSNGLYTDDLKTDAVMSDFKTLSEEEVEKLIRHSITKSCDLDPIPTWVNKQCIDVIIITRSINVSLTSSTMPGILKEAILAPLIKKSLLDPEIFKNFLPISNLLHIKAH